MFFGVFERYCEVEVVIIFLEVVRFVVGRYRLIVCEVFVLELIVKYEVVCVEW